MVGLNEAVMLPTVTQAVAGTIRNLNGLRRGRNSTNRVSLRSVSRHNFRGTTPKPLTAWFLHGKFDPPDPVAWDHILTLPIVVDCLHEHLNLFSTAEIQWNQRNGDQQFGRSATRDLDRTNFPPTPCGLVLISIPGVQESTFTQKIRAAQAGGSRGRMKPRRNIQVGR